MTSVRAHQSDVTKLPEHFQRLAELEPRLRAIAYPPRDVPSILSSLHFQASRHRDVNPPDNLAASMRKVVQEYPFGGVPAGFNPDGSPHWKKLEFVARDKLSIEVKQESTPGVPLCKIAASNGQLLSKMEDDVARMATDRLRALADVPEAEFHKLSPVEIVRRGYADPIKLFVKNEGHDVETKIKTGRVRLISSVSLVDQIVERILSSKQNVAEKLIWEQCPSKCGIGFDDLTNRRFFQDVHRRGKRAESDISGFDWSVNYWELLADVEMRVVLSCTPNDGIFARILRNRVRALACPVFALPDGTLLAQTTPGVQKSGSFNTSPTNSRIRRLLAQLVGADWAVTAGDDCVEQEVADGKAKYEALGRICKFYRVCDEESFEFCSRRYTAKSAAPTSWLKGLFNVLSNRNVTEELRADLKLAYGECDEWLWMDYLTGLAVSASAAVAA